MSFGAPIMLLGLLAVAAPIVIHLINRQRAARVRFPAMAFLLASQKKLARRLKLKQLALLATRIAFFLLLPLAMAQPSFLCGGEAETTDGRLPASVVFVIDDSGSMSHPLRGGDVYAAAVALAESRVRDLRSWDQAALVFTSSTAIDAVGDLTDDRGTVLDALGDHTPRYAGSDIRAALAAARDIQETSRLPVRRTVLITDHAAIGWPDAADELPSSGLGRLEVIRLGPEAPTNVAVTDVSYERSASGAAGEYAVTATLRAWGGEPREVEATLRVNGDTVGATLVEVSPDGETSAAFVHSFEGTRAYAVEVSIDGDTGAAVDDRFGVPLVPDRAVRALLVNGDARGVALNDEVFFLRNALDLSIDDQREIEPRVTSPDELASATLTDVDVVVLANVAALPVPQVERLRAFVADGGGLLMSAGSNVDPERWNSLFGPLLPRPVRSVKVLATRGQSDASIQSTRVGEIDVLHPAVRVFGLRGGESIRTALVYRYVLLEPDAESDATIVTRFADGGPALLERNLGSGRVMLWTTTLDDGWTDLPLATTYVPLVRRLVQYLARRGAGGETQAALGERVVLEVGALRAERVVVTDPNGDRHILGVESGQAAYVPSAIGLHAVAVTTNDTDADVPTLDFVANAASSESDPAALDEALVAEAETRATEEASLGTGAEAAPGRSAWPILLFLALCALYAETLLGIRRRLWVRLRAKVGGNAEDTAL